MPELSVIISAGDRPQDVVAAVASLEAQNDAATDVLIAAPHDPSELERAMGSASPSRARVVARAELGAVVSETQSELIAFIDAGLVPDAGWVSAIRAGAERHRASATMFGPVSLAFDGKQPEWLAGDGELFLRWLGRLELGHGDRELTGDETAIEIPATNVVVRREAFRGVAGALPIAEAARVLVARQWAAGAPACYLGGARAVRRVPREQSVPRWFVLRAFDEGRASAAGLAALHDVLPAGALAAFAATKGDELASSLRRLELMGISFSRLPLRWRAELGELMGLVAGVEAHSDADYKRRLAHVDPQILDGDAPEAFLDWLDDVSRSSRGGTRASVGAA